MKQDKALVEEGLKKISWAWNFMPVLRSFEAEHVDKQPLKNKRICTCLHLEAKTACLLLTLKNLGAEVSAAGSNPLSTQDDVCAALSAKGVRVYSKRGMSAREYVANLNKALDIEPHIVIDDGADLIALLHTERQEMLPNIRGAAEETTTGINRLKAMESSGVLALGVIAVNDAKSKFLFDNRYGTGQSVVDGILRTTNVLIAGKVVVVAGYGWCGRGVAMRMQALGAKVIVVEADPHKAFEAVMDGHAAMSMKEAALLGDLFLTLTGNRDVIRKEHFEIMKDGAILGNAGHFDVEINKKHLEELAVDKTVSRENILTYILKDGRKLHLLAEGRLVNLAAADGHPIEIMDLSFSTQLLCALHINDNSLSAGVIPVPEDIDRLVVKRKLETMGVTLEEMTEGQKDYLRSWRE
ncbi:adenosylhomocysteinase [Thermovirga sp.]|uniref:adenosylhomocysteinase n=1 Tax=Thermovirga sp. TaxID=2699834 RepID=UPI0025D15160|nr:adenosylhomocysteinase [Thermovirga sp.]MBO8153552.1 adenosylhomocysteinase [Thermovirga sp.]